MKIYTKKGDDGTTSLIGGTRVPKHHVRVEAYGCVDELNVCIGLLADQPGTEACMPRLREIQDRLFTIGASLAADPEASRMVLPELRDSDISVLEQDMDQMDAELSEMKNFVLPGASYHFFLPPGPCYLQKGRATGILSFRTGGG